MAPKNIQQEGKYRATRSEVTLPRQLFRRSKLGPSDAEIWAAKCAKLRKEMTK